MVRKIIFLTFFLFYSALFVAAQFNNERPRAEVFAGYSVLGANYEAEIPNPSEPVITAFDGKQSLNGFNVSATRYFTRGFGVTGDFSIHFKTNKTPDPLGGNIETNISVYNITGGAQYKFRNSSRIMPFVRGLAGIAITRSKLKVSSLNVSETSNSTDFALAMGGGLDVRVNNRVDLRAFQVDYNPIFLKSGIELGFGNSRADNVRFSFGIVFK
jgi:opacity protein-like surface antigen